MERSMRTVKIKNIIIGEGVPKICAPITSKTKGEIIEEAAVLKKLPVDIIEWRADWFNDVFEIEKVMEVLKDLRDVLKEIPLLFTFRSYKEGGVKAIDVPAYSKLIKAVAETALVDMVDVEILSGDEVVRDIMESVQKKGVKAIASYHNFKSTPSKNEMICCLRKMQDFGADILKIAVMPKNKLDVLELLQASVTMYEKYADRPLITIAMSEKGIISRLSGEVFGSAVTFSAGEKASAPGQIDAESLYDVLQLLHKNITYEKEE